MDGHSSVKALLQFLKRKVEYQKFQSVPPLESQEQAGDDKLLLVKQRARACTTCFLFTDRIAKLKLHKPMIVLVMDLTNSQEIALTLFRHSPHNIQRMSWNGNIPVRSTSTKTPTPTDVDMTSLCTMFANLDLTDKADTRTPRLTALAGPFLITPETGSLMTAVKKASRILADFSRTEFNSIVVIGGRDARESSMSDQDDCLDPSGYRDNMQVLPGFTWNLLLFLQSPQETTMDRRAITHHSNVMESQSEGFTLDLDNIPIIVHLGVGDFPAACGALLTGLLANYAWEDVSTSKPIDYTEKSIPRPFSPSFDLDKDAVTDDDEDESMENDIDPNINHSKKKSRITSPISPLVRKREEEDNEDEEVDTVVRRLNYLGDSDMLRYALKRCKIEDQPKRSIMNGRRSRSSSFDADDEDVQETRPMKRLFRGASFDKIVKNVNSKPLATLVEGVPLSGSDLDSLNYSLKAKKCKENNSMRGEWCKESSAKSPQKHRLNERNDYLSEEEEEGEVLKRLASPQRKYLDKSRTSITPAASLVSALSKKRSPTLSPIKDVPPQPQGLSTNTSDSPVTSGEDASGDTSESDEDGKRNNHVEEVD